MHWSIIIIAGVASLLLAASVLRSGRRMVVRASNSGAVMLSDLAGKLTMLDVACSKCDPRGRLSVAKLIAEHGAPTGCHS